MDRELRGALVLAVDDLPRRPTKGWQHAARGQTRPAGHLPERIAEYAAHGGQRERIKGALCGAVARAVDLAFDGVAAVRAA